MNFYLIVLLFTSFLFQSVYSLPEPVPFPNAAPMPSDGIFDDNYFANPTAHGYTNVSDEAITAFNAEFGNHEVTSDDPWGGNMGHVMYKCETTAGSPLQRDVIKGCRALMEFTGADAWCPQKTPNNGCTLMGRWGTAAIGICGFQKAGLICGQIGWWAVYIGKHCKWKGLAGGKIMFPWRFINIYVFHVRDS